MHLYTFSSTVRKRQWLLNHPKNTSLTKTNILKKQFTTHAVQYSLAIKMRSQVWSHRDCTPYMIPHKAATLASTNNEPIYANFGISTHGLFSQGLVKICFFNVEISEFIARLFSNIEISEFIAYVCCHYPYTRGLVNVSLVYSEENVLYI